MYLVHSNHWTPIAKFLTQNWRTARAPDEHALLTLLSPIEEGKETMPLGSRFLHIHFSSPPKPANRRQNHEEKYLWQTVNICLT